MSAASFSNNHVTLACGFEDSSIRLWRICASDQSRSASRASEDRRQRNTNFDDVNVSQVHLCGDFEEDIKAKNG